MNVLIIDDNDMTATLLQTILASDGYRILGPSRTGQSGLEDAVKNRPDIICLDINLPDGSGVEILKQLGKALPETVVLMVTGTRDAATVKECMENGAKGFLIKPLNATTVLKTINEVANRRAS